MACPRLPPRSPGFSIVTWVSPPAHLLPSWLPLLALCCSSFPICSESQPPTSFHFPFLCLRDSLLLSLLLTPASTGDPHHPPPPPPRGGLSSLSPERDLSPPSPICSPVTQPSLPRPCPHSHNPFYSQGSLCSRPSCGERRGLLSVTQAPWNVGPASQFLVISLGRAEPSRRLGSANSQCYFWPEVCSKHQNAKMAHHQCFELVPWPPFPTSIK